MFFSAQRYYVIRWCSFGLGGRKRKLFKVFGSCLLFSRFSVELNSIVLNEIDGDKHRNIFVLQIIIIFLLWFHYSIEELLSLQSFKFGVQ